MEQLTQNWLCWVIVLLAVFCYQQLWSELLILRKNNLNIDDQEVTRSQQQQEFTGTLIGVLPLLGLFGTIVGLLECFIGMASDGVSSELVSGGIGDALLTTQLGITCAIPAWLLHAYVKACWQRELVSVDAISTDKVIG
jgi:biopolymer transport protein ExbB